MSPALLPEVGEALFGNEWRLPLARALGVDRRTVHRWMAGQNPVPSYVGPETVGLLLSRIERLHALTDKCS